jgi:hypothetical protein
VAGVHAYSCARPQECSRSYSLVVPVSAAAPHTAARGLLQQAAVATANMVSHCGGDATAPYGLKTEMQTIISAHARNLFPGGGQVTVENLGSAVR